MSSDLSKVKVGDYICTAAHGWERVVDAHEISNYPINTEISSYTIDDKLYIVDKFPTASVEMPEELGFGPKPCEFKKGEVIAIRDHSQEDWEYDKFIQLCYDGSYETEQYISRYARKLTSEERGE